MLEVVGDGFGLVDIIVGKTEEQVLSGSPNDETSMDVLEYSTDTTNCQEQLSDNSKAKHSWNQYLATSVHLCALITISLFWVHKKQIAKVYQKKNEVVIKKERSQRENRVKDPERKSGLQCRYCLKQFKNETIAIHHEKMLHEGRFTVNCEFCGKQFNEEYIHSTLKAYSY